MESSLEVEVADARESEVWKKMKSLYMGRWKRFSCMLSGWIFTVAQEELGGVA